ncbi:ATP-binding protein [Spirosoma pulveris]
MLHRNVLISLLVSFVVSTATAQQYLLPTPEKRLTAPDDYNLFVPFMTEGRDGRLYLASDNGLITYDGYQFGRIRAKTKPVQDAYDQVRAGPTGRIWTLRESGNLSLRLAWFDLGTKAIQLLADTTRLAREYLAQDTLRTLFTDRSGQLWLGLRNNGLLRIDPKTLQPTFVWPQKTAVRAIAEAPDGKIWVATSTGLYGIDPQTKQARSYPQPANPADSGRVNTLYAIHVRANGDVLTCVHNTLHLLHPATGQMRRIPWSLPLITSRQWTNKFVDDRAGNTYFSVGTFVFRLSPQNELQRLEFARPTEKVISIHISQGPRLGTDRLWVNAGRKLYAYDLSRLRPMRVPLNMLDVTVNGTRLVENQQQPEERFQRDTTGQATITIQEGDFVQLRFSIWAQQQPSTHRFRLEGYDRQWTSYTDIDGTAIYSPPAGLYSFLVNYQKGNGQWTAQPARVWLRVVPPFWKTGWFLTLALLTVCGASFWAAQNWSRRQKLRQELTRQAFEAATLRQLDEMKTQFFANITHELRTPLSIILNASNQLASLDLNEQYQRAIGTIERQSNQVLGLINQLLDIARLKAGKREPNPQLGNPATFVRDLTEQIRALAETRHISLINSFEESEPSERLYTFDSDTWERIMYNLLSNAVKFTPHGGQVTVTGQHLSNDWFMLRVADTGIGIPANQVEHVFERFGRVDGSATQTDGGTGIGLALVKELTEWLGGHVAVESIEGQGSTFTVMLPIRLAVPDSVRDLATFDPTGITPAEAPLVLLIEDNPDLQQQVADSLSGLYRVIMASDGLQGIEMALANVPDLIVSDVMMPGLDGYELTQRLKTHDRTSHIPLILLTSRSAADSRLKGLQAGADEYLSKPFSLAELSLRIGNSLQTRQKSQERFTQVVHGTGTPSSDLAAGESVGPTDRESRFLDRLRQAVLTHISQETLDVDWLADQACMSRTQLHRKLTALTGLSPNRFMQRIRLERAAELLNEGEWNVAQVANQVGYSSPSYFARLFQEQFGYAPARFKSLG